jgi:Domain of unknown function (DUF3291)
MDFHFAELNVARLRLPLDAVETREFVSVLDAVNQIAEVSPGFVWRLQGEDNQASSYVVAYDDPLVIVNLTVWTDVESLRHFTYRSGHGAYFRRRSEWFEPAANAHMVCWWIPVGNVPDLAGALRRLDDLNANGPSDNGFLFNTPLPKPGHETGMLNS